MNRLIDKVAAVVVVLVALMVCAGCGGGSSSNKASSGPTTVKPDTPGGASIMGTVPLPKPACDLLTRDEIAKALGTPVMDATSSGDASCTWGQAVDKGTSVDVTVVKAAPGAGTEACKTERDTQPRDLPKESVSGVGDSATWIVEQLTTIRQGHLLACWSNGAVVVLLTSEKDAEFLKTAAVALANQVHSGLT